MNPAIYHLNRCKNVLPFENSIVRLDKMPYFSANNYINANFIHSSDSDFSHATFIATQGPLKETTNSFWKMVTTLKCPLVIALIESDLLGERCYQYWPSSHAKSIKFGNLTIKSDEHWSSNFADIKALGLTSDEITQPFSLTHVHVKSWRDGRSLERAYYNEFLELLKLLHAYVEDNPGLPIVVHCSAGIGRTCTLIAAYYLYVRWLKCIEDNKEYTFSVYSIVKWMRGQRWMAVHCFEQYSFLYEIVKFFI
jgi:protein-tyrosine phosphatase